MFGARRVAGALSGSKLMHVPHDPALAVVFALLAAALFAVASVTQQRAAAAVPGEASLVRGLLRSPRWWAGIVGDAGGYGMQVAALAFGTVLLVQPILVSALVFALPLAAWLNGTRIDARTWAAALALVAALVCFLVVGNPSAGETTAAAAHWIVPFTVLLALVAAATVLARTSAAPGRKALLLGAASGALFGIAAALTTHVTDLFTEGIGTVVTSWQTWALVLAGAVGLYLSQRAYQAGPLASSLPAATIAEPMAAAFLGLTVLGEHLRTDTLGLAITVSAVIIMCATTIRLSRAQAEE